MVIGDLKVNTIYTIYGFKQCCPQKILRRLCDLGFVKGENFKVVRKSLLNKVLLIEIGGYTLSAEKKILDFLNLEIKNGNWGFAYWKSKHRQNKCV